MPADPRFREAVRRAFLRLDERLVAAGPTLERHLRPWIRHLVPGDDPWTYLLNVRSFPVLYLPWYLEQAARGDADDAFQEDLLLSSVSGYYYIRLIDQVMDEADPPERRLLPALNVFHLAFLEPYARLFPAGHPFHGTLAGLWTLSSEVTLRDGLMEDFDEAGFREAAARKTVAARIPLEAVLKRHGGDDLRGPWTRFLEVFAPWHQMDDDVFDWHGDLQQGRPTWFTCEARRRAADGGAPGAWVLGEGLPWAFALLDRWWEDVLEAARPLASPGLDAWLAERARVHAERRAEVLGPLALLRARFLQSTGGGGPTG